MSNNMKLHEEKFQLIMRKGYAGGQAMEQCICSIKLFIITYNSSFTLT